ncbi:PorP/SprF family type IX secretion system membrane protein [Tenacibaculum sp. M341]|uniref:PorP/SprF family type IX secretion system membrane protein n=1 Tax=Tenacibaculum sp. M341 TaxID=2530339 RepID=UPI0010436C38|nr:type IX secretion system membrane protein PorP/SprF [Tenacibaculum sp. M341]TCI94762.1 type IX secretion system membrane protein PorP/SprF [Tenacibaculum sp. M341]
MKSRNIIIDTSIVMQKKVRGYFGILCVLQLLISVNVHGQQYPQFTQYTYNMNIVNPAYAGVKNTLSINLLGRTQWTGVEGAPKTGTLGIHSPLGARRFFGIGFSGIYNEIGPLKETHLYGDLSYKVNVSKEGILSFGLKFGISTQNVNQSLLRFNNTDNSFVNLANNIYPNLGFGVYFKEEDFYVSLSMPNVLSTNFFETLNATNVITETSRNSTLYFGAGYVFKISEKLKFKPAFMVRYSSIIPTALDISNTAFIEDKFEIGVSYRLKESIGCIAAIHVNDHLRVGYSYDFSVGNVLNNNGSHEIMLLYDIDLKDKLRRLPRYY